MSSQNPFQNVKAGVETAVADVQAVIAKDAPIVAADIAKAKAVLASGAAAGAADITKAKAILAAAKVDVIEVDSKLTVFIKNNAKKIATGVLALAAYLVWHFLF